MRPTDLFVWFGSIEHNLLGILLVTRLNVNGDAVVLFPKKVQGEVGELSFAFAPFERPNESPQFSNQDEPYYVLVTDVPLKSCCELGQHAFIQINSNDTN